LKSKSLVVLLIVAVIAVVYTMVAYNGFIKKEEAIKKRANDLQANYQRRLDLLPSLVSVVKGTSEYEKNTLIEVANLRNKAADLNIHTDPSNAEEFAKLEAEQSNLANAANRLIAVIEKYPELNSTKSYLDLQEQLQSTERRIKFGRKDFNEAIATYNIATRGFPSSLVAKLFGFRSKDGFQADTGTDNAPTINFQTKK
jgi:LemA protein